MQLERVFKKVRHLIVADARHKRGFRISQCTPIISAAHMVSEAGEALDAIALRHLGEDHINAREKIVDELGDTLNCLVHTAIQLGINSQEIGDAAIRKLGERFKV